MTRQASNWRLDVDMLVIKKGDPITFNEIMSLSGTKFEIIEQLSPGTDSVIGPVRKWRVKVNELSAAEAEAQRKALEEAVKKKALEDEAAKKAALAEAKKVADEAAKNQPPPP
jgi:hypothetical protein